MAKLIGGPLHGQSVKTDSLCNSLIVPVFSNNRMPKQQRHGLLTKAEYRRTRVERGGESIYRFSSGYYEANWKTDSQELREIR